MSIEKGNPARLVDLFGGSGEVLVWNLLAAAAEPFKAVLSCSLAPSGSVGRHVQEEFPEIVLCVEGEGEANVDGNSARLHPGDVVYLPLGSILSIANSSNDRALRYLIIKAATPV